MAQAPGSRDTLIRLAFAALAVAALFPSVSGGMALLAGLVFAVMFENPFSAWTRRWTTVLLQLSVVGLGAGMDIGIVARVGVQGIGYTVAGIALTFALGALLARLLRGSRDTALLVTSGTAICGGSAIAAIAPVIAAEPGQVAVALATVFLLNAAALLIFPPVGHVLGLSQGQFGLWSALAIHDTSSVVGASLQYGAHALEVATTVKLARALWIVPLALAIGAFRSRKRRSSGASAKLKKPWFILGFLAVAALVTAVPALRPAGERVAAGARRVLVLTLFLIGSGLTRQALGQVGLRPFVHGLVLWILVGGSTLAAIAQGWVR